MMKSKTLLTAFFGFCALTLAADRLADYRWLLEVDRISLFAQELRTAEPVSPKRLSALWGSVTLS